MDLPQSFLLNMQTLLKDDYQKYLDQMAKPAVSGMRVNLLKVLQQDEQEICKTLNAISKIDYTSNGYIVQSSKIGKHPYHIAGLVYVQEPSSMIPVVASGLANENITDDFKVLDLCSAPGGKSGQIAEILAGKGVLVSNEIEYSRAKILQGNIERMGYTNVIITCASPNKLSQCLPCTFDYIFVDAPCSGEGMFRKDPQTITQWKDDRILSNSFRQKEILSQAEKMLKPNGKIIYSTCTFNKSENEDVIDWATENLNLKTIAPDKKILDCTTFLNNPNCRRFYPFICKGEGQFVCVMQAGDKVAEYSRAKKIVKLGNTEVKLSNEFLSNFSLPFAVNLTKVGSNICAVSQNVQKILSLGSILPVINAGVTLGSVTTNRFVVHNNAFTAFGKYANNKFNFNLQDPNVTKYLHGEELPNNGKCTKGYGVVTCNGYVLGGVKIVGNTLKNLLPKGIRI